MSEFLNVGYTIRNMNKTISFLNLCLMMELTGCSVISPAPSSSSTTILDARGIEVASRALPTQQATVVQPAHYQHVYVDSSDPQAGSLQTVTLKDAVENNVLASTDKKVQRIDKNGLNWLVFDKSARQPSEIEAVGGIDVLNNNSVEVNFDTDKTDILNIENLQPLIVKASRVSGVFYVVGYADETGSEGKNELLSQNRAKSVVDTLVAAGVNRSRINDFGAGVSHLYSDLALNRRTSVLFNIDD